MESQSLAYHDRPIFTWDKVVQYGLISGIGILYVCLVGMVETFHKRDVIFGVLSLGRSLLVVISLGMGYVIASKTSKENIGKTLLSSVLAGLISSALMVLFVVIAGPLNMRSMFVNASPALMKILTFSQDSQLTGLMMLTGMITSMHLLGAVIHLLPNFLRRFVIAGLTAVLLIGMLQELLNVILSRSDVTKPLVKLLFARSGLSIQGTIIVFLVFGAFHLFWVTQGRGVGARVSKLPTFQQRVINWAAIAIAVLILIFLPQIVGPYITQILVLVGLYLLMGLGLNIEIGLAGLLDLGFVGFFAIGAYTVALFTTTSQ